MRDHFETFRVEAARLRDGDGLARFVEAEFRAFLRCGWLGGGLRPVPYRGCRSEKLVAFSCCLQTDTMTNLASRAVQ